MVKKNRKKQVYLSYNFDRLGHKKLSQVYRLLVPDRFTSQENKERNHIRKIESENSSHLYESIIR